VITLEDVSEQLDAIAALDPARVGDWSDETVSAVLAAEHAAQRSVLNVPSPRPVEVDMALMIRVLHNLATTNGDPLVRVGVHAEGVREIEMPYSKRTQGNAEPDPTPTRRGSKAAKKTAATTAATTKEGTS